MKRDLNLIRSILLELEVIPSGKAFLFEVDPSSDYLAHLSLLESNGFIKYIIPPSIGTEREHYMIAEINWLGHDFIDSVRDEEIWRKTKDGVTKAGAFSFELLKALAKRFAKKKIEQHTGIELEL